MIWICEKCGPGKPFPEDETMCLRHMKPLVQYQPPEKPSGEPPEDPKTTAQGGPAEDGRETLDPDYCWNCGEPAERSSTECTECHKILEPPALQLRFPHGDIEVETGDQAELGRLGRHGRVFYAHPNVSRRHALVGVDRTGRAWIEPLSSALNGTFVDGRELSAGRHPLSALRRLRLARDVECTVRIFRAGPR